MDITFVDISDITIKNRYRKEFSEKTLSDLQESISTGPGLLNPIYLKPNLELVAGETRLKAITTLHSLGLPVKFTNLTVEDGKIPAIILSEDMGDIEYLEAELHENTHREGLSFTETSLAVAKIAQLKQMKLNKVAEDSGVKKEKFLPLGIPMASISKEAIKQTAEQLNDGKSGARYDTEVAIALQVANAVENNPELAQKLKQAVDMSSAKKILNKHAQDDQRKVLAAAQGKQWSNKIHNVLQGDCLEVMKTLIKSSFDVCLTDPIYGMNAHKFGDGAGKMSSFSHTYDDSPETFKKVLPQALKLVSQLLKQKAHMYLACDLGNFELLKQFVLESDQVNPWKVYRVPYIQYKLAGGRVPHPGYTPRRSYECWLYAYRGEKQLYKTINDVIECVSDKADASGGHGAGKPIDLLKTFLSLSCLPGDTVIDFMAGSGSILTAAHELKVKCTAIEIDATNYGNCLQRLERLK
jgi:ParB-like chromosome segregation protein Spo0J